MQFTVHTVGESAKMIGFDLWKDEILSNVRTDKSMSEIISGILFLFSLIAYSVVIIIS